MCVWKDTHTQSCSSSDLLSGVVEKDIHRVEDKKFVFFFQENLSLSHAVSLCMCVKEYHMCENIKIGEFHWR